VRGIHTCDRRVGSTVGATPISSPDATGGTASSTGRVGVLSTGELAFMILASIRVSFCTKVGKVPVLVALSRLSLAMVRRDPRATPP
jgi:hypothetical protein